MVQTSDGAANSEWLNFIKECAAEYHARKQAAASSKSGKGEAGCTCRGKAARGKSAAKKAAGMAKVTDVKMTLKAKSERP